MDSALSSAHQLMQVAVDKWAVVQVELHGKYSLERIRALYHYEIQSRWYRILFWCIATPIPCLALNILLDIVPLAQPSAGREANYIFWIRLAIFSIILVFLLLMQAGFLTPALGMTHWRALSSSFVVTLNCMIYTYVVAGLIPMPVLFLLLAATPVFPTTTAAMIGFYFGRRLMNDAVLRASFIRWVGVYNVQFVLVLIYPAFIYGFNSIPSRYQTPYMILVPVIKIISKNVMSKHVGNNDDMKPVELIFNVDCFNAIYVSLAMQRSTTISTSLFVMLIDAVQGCVSVYDVYQGFQPLKNFLAEIPDGHPLQGKSFLEVAIDLNQEIQRMPRQSKTSSARLSGPTLAIQPAKPSNGIIVPKASNKVFVAPRIKTDISVYQTLSTTKTRVAFINATRKLLFTTEFVILVEYTEVIMPVLYSEFHHDS